MGIEIPMRGNGNFRGNEITMGSSFWDTNWNGNGSIDVEMGLRYCMCVKKVLFRHSNMH